MQTKKIVAIYFDEPGRWSYPFTVKKYVQAYADLCKQFRERNIEPRVVRSLGSYRGNGIFSMSWELTDSCTLIKKGKIRADLVFDRGPDGTLIEQDVPRINSLEFNQFCDNKQASGAFFSDLVPESHIVRDSQSLDAALATFSEGEKVVFKPIRGFGGSGVMIANDHVVIKDEVLQNEALLPGIVQKFIDTSSGAGSTVLGMHDIRIIVVGDEMVTAFVRKPAEGSYLANVSQGGSIYGLEINSLPDYVLNFANSIVSKVNERYGKNIYSIDLVVDKSQKPWLIELNARPGLNPKSAGYEAEIFITKIVDFVHESLANIEDVVYPKIV